MRTSLLLAGLLLALVGAVTVGPSLVVPLLDPGTYGEATVTAVDENGTALATVEVRVANTTQQRYVGLSRADSLAPGTGMLFVHPSEGTYSYVMRNMSFPLDIVFVDANRTITAIHHAPVPPPGTVEADLTRYSGRAKWVLEVNRGWANETGVAVGDRLVIDRAE